MCLHKNIGRILRVNSELQKFDKHELYKKSVQEPEADIDIFEKIYQEKNPGKSLVTLKEDFCGTYAICCEWARKNPNNKAIGVDYDQKTLSYGKEKYFSTLNEEQKQQVKIYQQDVRRPVDETADITCALNFSYFIFKERQELKEYFSSALNGLNEKGLFILDIFGGSQCYEPNEEETEHSDLGFSYFWDQDSFDPITNHAKFYIHFKIDGQKKVEKVFTYDWRMWSVPEIKDLLKEAGFKNVDIYWEGSDEDGDGNGEFEIVKNEENCESWIAYIVAQK
jgi:hypothetical protein